MRKLFIAVVVLCLVEQLSTLRGASDLWFVVGWLFWCYVVWRAWPAVRQDFARIPLPGRYRRTDEASF